jgi:hypothetical protein
MLRPPHQQQRCLPRAKQHLLSENNAAAESTPSASESVPGASLSDSRAARPWNCLLWRRLAAGISKKSSSSRNQQKKQQQQESGAAVSRAPKNQRSHYSARRCHAFGARAGAQWRPPRAVAAGPTNRCPFRRSTEAKRDSPCRLGHWRQVPPGRPAASAGGGRPQPPALVAAGGSDPAI